MLLFIHVLSKALFAVTYAAPRDENSTSEPANNPSPSITSILTGYVAGAINTAVYYAKYPLTLTTQLDTPKEVNGVPTTSDAAVMAANIVPPEHFEQQMNTFE